MTAALFMAVRFSRVLVVGVLLAVIAFALYRRMTKR